MSYPNNSQISKKHGIFSSKLHFFVFASETPEVTQSTPPHVLYTLTHIYMYRVEKSKCTFYRFTTYWFYSPHLILSHLIFRNEAVRKIIVNSLYPT